jgi:hypothetical protein
LTTNLDVICFTTYFKHKADEFEKMGIVWFIQKQYFAFVVKSAVIVILSRCHLNLNRDREYFKLKNRIFVSSTNTLADIADFDVVNPSRETHQK